MNSKSRRNNGIRTAADLMDRCKVDSDTACWHWHGARDAHGRPSMWCPALSSTVSLGVLSALLRTGHRPAKGTAWHCQCTTRDCANPAHRTPGTRSSQMLALRMQRTPAQRAKVAAGKRKGGKLTDADVEAIRNGGLLLREIVARYGISTGYACEVRSGKRRADLAAPGSSVFAWRPA